MEYIGCCILLLAVVFDLLIGDPRVKFHPVVMIGHLISWLENKLLCPGKTPIYQNIMGGLLVAVVLLTTYGTVLLVKQLLAGIHIAVNILGSAFLLSFTISPRSLAQAGQEILAYLTAKDLDMARYKVGWIVGRDTANLDEAEVTRATVETIAENIVDGVIAPLFFFILGGVPLAFLYRASNTLDSMIGYKNQKYRHFGMIAARLDDLLNYIPARLTALLIVLSALVLRFDALRAIKSIMRDASKHPSPNSGWPESAVAGALKIRLGGLNYYGGKASFRAFMGEPMINLSPIHIKQTISIMFLTICLFCLLACFVYFKAGYFISIFGGQG